ncbi:MAG: T9SS type A sorting domain-containing protein [Flavobacteriaceae bacterium]|nr:T9SS type A sorting domain-containing protein [Flavobacteriaceae bacterium]
MKHLYILFILSLSSGMLLAQTSPIMRASLSASFDTSQDTNSRHKIAYSVGHMGVMAKADQKNHTVISGFLLPQGISGTPVVNPIELTIYPVPFDTHLNVEFKTAVNGDLSVRLLDVTGRLVFDKIQTAEQQQRFDIGELAQGEYFIEVILNNQTFTKSIIKK